MLFSPSDGIQIVFDKVELTPSSQIIQVCIFMGDDILSFDLVDSGVEIHLHSILVPKVTKY